MQIRISALIRIEFLNAIYNESVFYNDFNQFNVHYLSPQ